MSERVCTGCGRRYAYALQDCTFCGSPLAERTPATARVAAVTEVRAPSTGHEDVPYWVAFLEADDGSRSLLKLDHPVTAGDEIAMAADERPALAVIGILGTGVMGMSLTELLLARGHRVVWVGRSEASFERARARVFDRLSRVMGDDEIAAASAALQTSVSYEPLGSCDVVIEAVVEELATKAAVLAEAESAMREDAILATNTSGLSLDDLAAHLSRPERFGGLHFFNPATRMRLVETTVCRRTSQSTSEALDALALSLGKIPIRVAATPAFVVNRVLMPLLNEAARAFEEGVAPADHIDEAVRLGLNHPMGPLALADLIGLDVVVDIMDNLVERTGDSAYTARPILRELVASGHLGRKTGHGFYDYTPSPAGAPTAQREV
jgi:3-hydroxybutyryl-CoA dehydrogenase